MLRSHYFKELLNNNFNSIITLSMDENIKHPYESIYHLLYFVYYDTIPRYKKNFEQRDIKDEKFLENLISNEESSRLLFVEKLNNKLESVDDLVSMATKLENSSNSVVNKYLITEPFSSEKTMEIAYDIVLLSNKYSIPNAKG